MRRCNPSRFRRSLPTFALLVVTGALAYAGTTLADEAKGSAAASSGDLSLNLVLDVSWAKYDTTRNYSNALTTTVAYETEHYNYSLAVPFLNQSESNSGSATTSKRVRLPPRIVSRLARRFGMRGGSGTGSGVGDLEGSVTRYLVSNPDGGLTLDVRGAIKFPTADERKGLGTGEYDYSIDANASKRFGNFTASGTLGYSVPGSPGLIVVQGTPQKIELKNYFYGSLDGAYALGDRTSVGIVLNSAQASSPDSSAQRDATIYLNVLAGKSARIRIFGQKGYTTGSADSAGGASASLSF